MIHFLTCRLTSRVHALGKGLTNVLHLYTWGEDAAEAERNARAYIAGRGLVIEAISPLRAASSQSLMSFVNPDEICGIPEAMAAKEIRLREHSPEMELCLLDSLAARHLLVRQGLELLAQPA